MGFDWTGYLGTGAGGVQPGRVVRSISTKPTAAVGGATAIGTPAANQNVKVGKNTFNYADTLNNLLTQFQNDKKQANTDGLAQYQNLLNSVDSTAGQVGSLYDKAGAALSTQGNTALSQINSGEEKNLATQNQNLISSGLNNTTIQNSVSRGVSADANAARNQLSEQLAGQQAGLLTQRAGATTQLGQLKADSILSRQNVAPDTGSYLSVLAQLAQSLGLGGNK